MKFIDCQGLAGHGTSLGAVQAGFEMVHRTALPGGFGNSVVNENRELLGFKGDIETGDVDTWTPFRDIAFVTGTPPCSGFSLMNTTAAVAKAQGKEVPANARGSSSAINMCQRQLVEYATTLKGTDGRPGPEFVCFESVQGAFSQGIDLMREYWVNLRQATGQDYQMSHIKMSVASIGGAQLRHRYFFLAHRIPFGIDFELPGVCTTLEDAIDDLQKASEIWEPQDYVDDADNDYARELRRGSKGITNNLSLGGGDDPDDPHAGTHRAISAMSALLPYWAPGKSIHTAAKAFVADRGVDALPDHLKKRWQPDVELFKGFMWPTRLGWDEPTGVLTGGCASGPIHPTQDRFLTVRELSRVMAVPDAWTWNSARNVAQAGTWIGKCCTTGAGKWLADAVMDALDGRPQARNEHWSEGFYKKTKLELAPGEAVYDITNEYTKYSNYYRHKR